MRYKYFIIGLLLVFFAEPMLASAAIQKLGHVSNGPSYDIVEKHGYLYVGQGAEVRVYNVSDKSKIKQLSWKDYISRIYTEYLVKALNNESNYLYIASTKKFIIADTSDPSNPSIISYLYNPSNAPTAEFYDVEIKGNYAYLSNYGEGVTVIDISNKANPVSVTTLKLPGKYNRPYRLKVSGNYLYVGTWTDYTLYIIDITNPANPSIVGTYSSKISTSIASTYSGIDVNGNYTYVSEFHNGLHVIDISNPSNPVEIATLPMKSADIKILDNHAYVSIKYQGFNIVDISNPTSPLMVSKTTTMPGYNEAIFPTNGYVYHTAITKGFAIIDASNIKSPVELVNVPVIGEAYSIEIRNNYLYIGARNDGIWIIDVTDPRNPKEAYFIARKGRYEDIHIQGNYLYTAGDWDALGIIDITDPLNPRTLINRFGGNIYSLYPDGNYIYTYLYYRIASNIVNTSTRYIPTNPAYGILHATTRNIEGESLPGKIYIDNVLMGSSEVKLELASGNHTLKFSSISDYSAPSLQIVQVSAGLTTDIVGIYGEQDNVLGIVDVSNPMSPVYISYSTFKGYFSNFAKYGNNYLIGAVGRGVDITKGLYIMDISDKRNPKLIKIYDNSTGYKDVKVEKNVAVALKENSIVTIDISDINNPVLLGEKSYPGQWSGQAIDVYGNISYAVGGPTKTVRIFDITNPFNIQPIGTLELPEQANDVRYYNGIIYVSDGMAGVYILSSIQDGGMSGDERKEAANPTVSSRPVPLKEIPDQLTILDIVVGVIVVIFICVVAFFRQKKIFKK